MSLIKGFENLCSIKDVHCGVVNLGCRQVTRFTRCGDRARKVSNFKSRFPSALGVSGIGSRTVVTAALRNIDWCVRNTAM